MVFPLYVFGPHRFLQFGNPLSSLALALLSVAPSTARTILAVERSRAHHFIWS
jgi:hypothetical protein